MFGVAPPVHVFTLRLAFCLDLLDDLLHHLRLLLGLDLLEDLVQPLQLLLGSELPVRPEHPGRVPVGNVTFVTLLGLEINLTLFAFEQTHIVDLERVYLYAPRLSKMISPYTCACTSVSGWQ